MTPIKMTKTRVRWADLASGLSTVARLHRADLVSNGVTFLAVLLAGLVTGQWALAGALLTLPVIAAGRMVVATTSGARDARDFLTYIETFAEQFEWDEDELDDEGEGELAEVIPLDSGTEANL